MQYQRTGYKVKLNHSNALPRYILSIHVESNTEDVSVAGHKINHTFRCASVTSGRLSLDKIVGRKTEHFTDKAVMWKYIYAYTKSNYTTWLIGENVLTACVLSGLPEQFEQSVLHIDKPRSKRKREDNDEENTHATGLAVIENPPTIIGCRVVETQGRLVIVDILNWFPSGLSTGYQPERLKTLAGDVEDTTDIGTRLKCTIASETTHKRFETLIGWVKQNDMGLFRYTVSAQAYGAFRHRFMQQDIYVHDNQDIQTIERQAYFGGRSEVFRLGAFDDRVYQLDCNSLFPSVMLSGWLPYQLHRFESRTAYWDCIPPIDMSASVAEVELLTDQPIYPVRTEKHIIYPVGRFTTTLCGVNLLRAHRHGHIIGLRSWSEYKLANIFGKWVNELWDMRQRYAREGNEPYEMLAKLMLNSLYGKFGQLTPAWQNVDNDWSMLPFTTESRLDGITGEWATMRSIGWQAQKLCERSTKPESFYAIPAFVTAAARARMDWLRTVAAGPNVYYQGVDSLIVNQQGLTNLLNADEIQRGKIGKLRIQIEADYIDIKGISDYQIGDKICLSGRAHNISLNGIGEVMQHKFYVRENMFNNGPTDTIEERIEEWQRTATYQKGIQGDSGWVSPFTVGIPPTSSILGSLPEVEARSARVST